MRLKSILFCLLIGAPCMLPAQISSDKVIVDEFFRLFRDDSQKAFDYAFSTNKWMESSQEAVDNLKDQFRQLEPLLGNYYGFEKITEKSITERLKLKSFLVLYDRQPLRFSFILYKPANSWQVHNLNYDDNLDDELKEAASQSKID